MAAATSLSIPTNIKVIEKALNPDLIRQFSSARGLHPANCVIRCGEERPESLEQTWHRFFDDPSLWWDNRAKDVSSKMLCLKDDCVWFQWRATGEGLWIASCPKWVHLKLKNLNTPYGDVRAQYKEGQRSDKEDVSILLSALKECRGPTDFQRVKMVHQTAMESSQISNIYVASSLVNSYAKCGGISEARRVFDRIPRRNSVTWNALMFGYLENGEAEAALELFARMETEPDARSFIAAVKACTSLALKEEARKVDGKLVKVESLNKGMAIHSQALDNGHGGYMFLENSLVDMYAKCGRMDKALDVFNKMISHNTVSWTALMFGYVENGEAEAALELFARIEQDGRSFVAAVKACTSLALKEEARKVDEKLVKAESLNKGMSIHSQALDNGHGGCMFLASSLVDMYAKCGRIDKALEVFNKMESHNTVSWNALMFGYVDNGDGELAFKLFMRMKSQGCAPNDVSFVAALKACTILAIKEDGKTIAGRIVKQASLKKGLVIHNQAVNSGYGSCNSVRSTLIHMYDKCGSPLEARKVFDATPNPDTVLWNTMILAYADNELGDQAIELFKRMGTPNAVTFMAGLKACCTVGAFQTGKDIHAAIRDQGLENKIEIASCLVDFYAKCGSMVEAQNVFDSLSKNSVTWTALMAGYSRHGDTGRVFQLFEQMRSKGVQPDGITFLCVLTTCSHAGLVEQGKEYFAAMGSEFQVKQELEHYTCMIDILGRANKLKEALSMVEEMPHEANSVTWMTVLGACRKWKNLEVGKLAFDSLIKLDDQDASAYILLENIYGSLNMWEEQHTIESKRLDVRAWRVPGQCWWSDLAGMVHAFVASDTIHSPNEKVQAKLAVMKEQDLGLVVPDMSGEQDKASTVLGNASQPSNLFSGIWAVGGAQLQNICIEEDVKEQALVSWVTRGYKKLNGLDVLWPG